MSLIVALVQLGSNTWQKWEDDVDILLVCGVNFLNISSDLVQIKAGAHTHIDSTNHKQSERSVYSRSKEINTKVGTFSTTFLCNFRVAFRSEEHTSELQSHVRISYAVFCLKKKKKIKKKKNIKKKKKKMQ